MSARLHEALYWGAVGGNAVTLVLNIVRPQHDVLWTAIAVAVSSGMLVVMLGAQQFFAAKIAVLNAQLRKLEIDIDLAESIAARVKQGEGEIAMGRTGPVIN